MAKLNLGSGNRRIPGFINVDLTASCKPDVVADLEDTPWPFRDDIADEVLMSHVLEHLGATGEGFLRIMTELYRICRDQARILIITPHPRHDDFLVDPTHVRAVLPETFLLFSKSKNLEWQARGAANTPFGLYLNVDFEVVGVTYLLDDPWRTMHQNGEMDDATLNRAIVTQNNIVKQTEVELLVHKPI
jgi:hypothetical protein